MFDTPTCLLAESSGLRVPAAVHFTCHAIDQCSADERMCIASLKIDVDGAGEQKVKLLQLLPQQTTLEDKRLGITCKVELRLLGDEKLLLSQPILQSREAKLLVVLTRTDKQGPVTEVHS